MTQRTPRTRRNTNVEQLRVESITGIEGPVNSEGVQWLQRGARGHEFHERFSISRANEGERSRNTQVIGLVFDGKIAPINAVPVFPDECWPGSLSRLLNDVEVEADAIHRKLFVETQVEGGRDIAQRYPGSASG